jgi:hypothetical protein
MPLVKTPSGRRGAVALTSGLVLAAVLAGALGGCGSSHGGASSSSAAPAIGKGSAGGGTGQPDSLKALAAGAVPQASGDVARGSAATTQADVLLTEPRLVLTAGLTVGVDSVVQAAARVRALTTAAGGYVGNEETSAAGPGSAGDSTLQLRVPHADLGALTNQISGLGTVTDRSETSADVTQKTVDVASRLATQKASVARIRALLARATKISDVVLIEGELSQRESSLESMEAQLKSLNNAVDLSTLNVQLIPKTKAAHHETKATTGFLPGLRQGWDAFAGAVVVALTVVGAVLPFAVLLALLGVPAGLIWRRRRSTSPQLGQPVPAPEA